MFADDIFGPSYGARRSPALVTYKRRVRVPEDSESPSSSASSSPVSHSYLHNNNINSNGTLPLIRSPTPVATLKRDVFDFPSEQDANDIEIPIVGSFAKRAPSQAPKRKLKKPKRPISPVATVPAPINASNSFNSQNISKKSIPHAPMPPTKPLNAKQINTKIIASQFTSIRSIAPAIPSSAISVPASNAILPCNPFNQPFHTPSTQHVPPKPTTTPVQPPRKMVSRLKSASGEEVSRSTIERRFFCDSESENEDEDVAKALSRVPVPTMSKDELMEKQLEELLRMEFDENGGSPSENDIALLKQREFKPTPAPPRPDYVPVNRIHAPIKYTRKPKPENASQSSSILSSTPSSTPTHDDLDALVASLLNE
ncbi:hypothetical protein BC940DRAFT_302781 [Gongronella butleri]|nr:hypothetical protein BC940DRAFT_302781 [Gongronella butleri]